MLENMKGKGKKREIMGGDRGKKGNVNFSGIKISDFLLKQIKHHVIL